MPLIDVPELTGLRCGRIAIDCAQILNQGQHQTLLAALGTADGGVHARLRRHGAEVDGSVVVLDERFGIDELDDQAHRTATLEALEQSGADEHAVLLHLDVEATLIDSHSLGPAREAEIGLLSSFWEWATLDGSLAGTVRGWLTFPTSEFDPILPLPVPVPAVGAFNSVPGVWLIQTERKDDQERTAYEVLVRLHDDYLSLFVQFQSAFSGHQTMLSELAQRVEQIARFALVERMRADA